MASPRMSVRIFVSGADLGNPWVIFFKLHMHIDVLFCDLNVMTYISSPK